MHLILISSWDIVVLAITWSGSGNLEPACQGLTGHAPPLDTTVAPPSLWNFAKWWNVVCDHPPTYALSTCIRYPSGVRSPSGPTSVIPIRALTSHMGERRHRACNITLL